MQSMTQHEVNVEIFFIFRRIDRFYSALEYTPADQKSLYRRANAFERIGKLNEAISDAQRLMAITSKSGPSDEQTNVLLRKLRENALNKVNLMRFLHRIFLHRSISILNKHNWQHKLNKCLKRSFPKEINTKLYAVEIGE